MSCTSLYLTRPVRKSERLRLKVVHPATGADHALKTTGASRDAAGAVPIGLMCLRFAIHESPRGVRPVSTQVPKLQVCRVSLVFVNFEKHFFLTQLPRTL